MIIRKAPQEFKNIEKKSIFLAGSIEMGTAEDWQTKLSNSLSSLDILVLNPRRDDWDSSWDQSIKDKNFKEQVTWELDAQDHADIIAMYFHPETKAPITLLELGLYAHTGKIRVCCPEGYWRKGNVEIVCDKYKLELFEDFEEFTEKIKEDVYIITS